MSLVSSWLRLEEPFVFMPIHQRAVWASVRALASEYGGSKNLCLRHAKFFGDEAAKPGVTGLRYPVF
jgi:hypothetical protein